METELRECFIRDGWEWKPTNDEVRKDGWRCWLIPSGPDYVIYTPNDERVFRGALTPKNYRTILDAVMGGGK